MAFYPGEGFSQAQEVFSSLFTDASGSDLPLGLSPDNQEVIFRPGKVATRPGFKKRLDPSPDPSEDVVSLTEYSLPIGDYLAMWMFSDGALWKQNNRTAGKTAVAQLPEGSQFRSVSAFEKQWFAFNNPDLADDFSKSPFVGADVPRYYDGTTLWRVTQDAPGANPSFTNVPVAPIQLVATTTIGTISISSARSTDPVTYQIQIGGVGGPSHGGGHGDPGEIETITIYTTITYGCTTPVPAAWLGTQITVTAIVGAGSDLVNVTGTIINVNGSNFTISVGTGSTFVNLTGLAGTGTVAGNYFQRSGNIVTAYVGATAPANLQAGLFAKVINSNASQINGPNWTITAISRDATGLVTITVSAQLTNLPSGASLYIAATPAGTAFPASYQTVFEVISITSTSTTFTVSNPTWGDGSIASLAAGSVHQTWSGTFQVLSVGVDANGENFFTYFQLGPDTNLTATGGTPQAQMEAQIPPGPRSAVLMFKSLNGAITAPSVPIQLSISGGTNLLSAQNIPIGPPGTAQRIIAFTPAFGASFYYITPAVIPAIGGISPVISLGTIISDNVSTTAILDFSDQQLIAGTQIDIEGNNLFNQVVLAPMLGCIDYAGRMGWWGEVNNIKNLINMGFDGGYVTATPLSPVQDLAGTGTDAGGAHPWTNPSNVTSTVSYATITLAANLNSDGLDAKQFGFTIPAALTVLGIQVDFEASSNPATALSGKPALLLTMLRAGTPAGVSKRAFVNVTSGPITSGGSADLWGTSWTAAQANDTAFGVRFSASANFAGGTFQVRNVRITVYVLGPPALPPGWDGLTTINGISPDEGGLLIDNPTDAGLGFAYEMRSGVSFTNNCMLSQGAYQDFYGAPILQPGRSYYIRFLGKVVGTFSGNLSFVLYSPSVGVLANVNVSAFTTSMEWITAQFSDQMPDSIPADTVFYFLLDGTATTDFILVLDELELVDVQAPVLFQQMRLSYFNNPFGYDQISGILGVAGAAKITAAFKQRGYLYLLTDGPMSQTQNNGQSEPNGWGVTQFADECDCFGPNGVTSTEDISWWIGNAGLRIFSGAKPVKLSQEIQPDWDTINKAVPLSMWTVNDPFERVLYIGIATGSSEVVNQIIPMSYRSVDATYNVPDPLHISYSGKMIASDLVRKWTRWNRPMSCGAILTLPAGKQMFFGGQGFGNFYSLDPTLKTDDDYGVIASYYTTSFFFNHDIEQQAQNLGLHRKIYEYMVASLTGTGNMQITAYVNNLSNPWGPIPTVWDDVNQLWIPSGSPTQIPAVVLPSESNFDLEWALNIRAERCAFRFAAVPLDGETDSGFELTHLVVSASVDVIPVRGSVIA